MDSTIYKKMVARQVPLWGEENQLKIARTKLALVGCGGNGSAFLALSVLAGFRIFDLVDFDTLELSNLNRFMFGGVDDIGKLKVCVAKEDLLGRFPDVRIRTFTKPIESPGIWDKIKGADWIIDALDNDRTRHFLDQKCAKDNIPMLSVACGFAFNNGRLADAGCRVNRVGPGDPSLEEQIMDAEQTHELNVSLVTINAIASALALDVLLRNATGYVDSHNDKNFVMFDLVNRTMTAERVL